MQGNDACLFGIRLRVPVGGCMYVGPVSSSSGVGGGGSDKDSSLIVGLGFGLTR